MSESTWWSDGLPEKSVVIDNYLFEMPLIRLHGRWWRCEPHFVASDEPAHVTITHVPVTDTEPPLRSLVWLDDEWGGVWERDREGWKPTNQNWNPEFWSNIRPRVTRILRWGE